MTRRAIITGISGQDGYFLTRLLIDKGYDVIGIVRRNSSTRMGTVDVLPEQYREKVTIVNGDITDSSFCDSIMAKYTPDEVYHLAAQSFVAYSFHNPSSTYDINIGGTLNIFNAVKEHSPKSRVYFAATSEMYGQPLTTPQNEETPLVPRSPYAISKLAGFWTAKVYREAYDLFISCGILFNHESEVRGPEFVTRKIAIGVSKIAKGDRSAIRLGNLDARKDWGFAGDYVEGMWQMLQLPKPDDFVLSTGETHTVREFTEMAFRSAGIEVEWQGSGINERGINRKSGEVLVSVSKEFFRPLESDNYKGDSSKAGRILGWKPKLNLEGLVERMVRYEMGMR